MGRQPTSNLLIHQLRQRISEKPVLRLIGKYLRAGVRLEDGSTEKTLKGVPQGGPLSPLLANIMLDPLDKKIEAMGLPFARYADDFLIVTRSKTRALEVMAEVREYVEGKLKLLERLEGAAQTQADADQVGRLSGRGEESFTRP